MSGLAWEQVTGRFVVASLYIGSAVMGGFGVESFRATDYWWSTGFWFLALCLFSFGMEQHVKSASEAYLLGLNSRPNLHSINGNKGQ